MFQQDTTGECVFLPKRSLDEMVAKLKGAAEALNGEVRPGVQRTVQVTIERYGGERAVVKAEATETAQVAVEQGGEVWRELRPLGEGRAGFALSAWPNEPLCLAWRQSGLNLIGEWLGILVKRFGPWSVEEQRQLLLAAVASQMPGESAPLVEPPKRERGPSAETRRRAEMFKAIKDKHPDWSYARVAREATRSAKAQAGLDEKPPTYKPDDVRNAYRAMGWVWRPARRVQ